MSGHLGHRRSLTIVQQYAIPPDQPGGTRHYEFAAIAQAQGFEVEIIASDFSHHEKRFFRRTPQDRRRTLTKDEGGVTFRYVWIPPYYQNDHRRTLSMAWFSLKVFLRVLFRPSDIIYASSPHIFCCVAALFGARLRRKSFVFEVRDLWPEHFAETGIGSQQSFQYRLIGWCANTLYRHSDLVVMFAAGSRETILKRGGNEDRLFLLDGIDVTAMAPRTQRTSAPDRFEFVYMGSIAPAYGLEMVLKACEILRKRGNDNFHVTFVGDGPDKADLQAMVEREALVSVTFRDPIPRTEVSETLATFDAGLVILLPTGLFSYGVSPQKLFDYMAVNLPVVTNLQGDVAHIVNTANAGIASREGTAESLADAMAEMADPGAFEPDRFSGGRDYLRANADRRKLSIALLDRIRQP